MKSIVDLVFYALMGLLIAVMLPILVVVALFCSCEDEETRRKRKRLPARRQRR